MVNLPIENWISLLGLIIACIALGWNILNEIRKTPRLRVTVMIAKIVQQGNPDINKDDYFSLSISNVGQRPVMVKGIGYVGYKWWWHPFKKQNFVILPKALPAYLKDGEIHDEMYAYKKNNFQDLIKNNMQRIMAYDSTGKNHFVSRIAMIKFRNEIKKHLTEKKEL